MKARQLYLVTSLLAASGLAMGASCTFPEVTFTNAIPGDGGADGEGDARIALDGSDPATLIVKDAGQKVDAASCDPADCDCDHDGFRSTQKAGCQGGANDCDDNDTRAQPNKGYVIDIAEAPMFGDWNCSGQVELLYPENIDCAALAPGTKSCDEIAGFDGTVGCGKRGTVVKCKTVPVPPLNLSNKCAVGTQLPDTQQACK